MASAGGWQCACVSGWTGDDCSTEVDECDSAPCQNGAVCNEQFNGYTCSCLAGYEGAWWYACARRYKFAYNVNACIRKCVHVPESEVDIPLLSSIIITVACQIAHALVHVQILCVLVKNFLTACSLAVCLQACTVRPTRTTATPTRATTVPPAVTASTTSPAPVPPATRVSHSRQGQSHTAIVSFLHECLNATIVIDASRYDLRDEHERVRVEPVR